MLNDIQVRALRAYRIDAKKASNGIGTVNEPSQVECVEIEKKNYVVLANVNGILSVYRVRIVNGKERLKELKRFPKSIVETFGK